MDWISGYRLPAGTEMEGGANGGGGGMSSPVPGSTPSPALMGAGGGGNWTNAAVKQEINEL